MRDFDVIVIGGGHAGCEAAAAAARRGARVALVTMDPNQIGAMSCNPAIGGVGKGHLVRELDVFDGLMARAADAAAIHHRMLNRSKGSAVHGPRVQADRKRFRAATQALIAAQPGLEVVAGSVDALVVEQGRVAGILLADGIRLNAHAVILATGTFLGAKLHCGLEQTAGGRTGEAAAIPLAAQLRELDLPMGRLKTGTPPRLDGRTIDWARLEPQLSDEEPWTLSALTTARALPQLACAMTRTNARTHDVIRAGLDRSPLFSGAIEGSGPRYCPSVEDKVVRFGDRDGHQIFLEPEGLDDPLVYPNGISTSLPVDVQAAMIRSIEGLEAARIVRPGYAVEYDYVDPRSLTSALGLRALPGLFCAGQINGTTGYEEAGAQGLVAGLNAAAYACDLAPVLFDRADSYIGVMVDDLTLQGVTEPYRMLTARAEYRLRLRADNAASRLGALAIASGAVGEQRRALIETRLRQLGEVHDILARREAGTTLADRVRQGEDVAPEVMFHVEHSPQDVIAEALDDARYAPYLDRQRAEVARLRTEANTGLGGIVSYRAIGGLSNEMVERLEAARPADLAAASRIRGITPAALAAILVAAQRRAA
ncbi:MAG TPA: tRNA uridine-5-carboxymethylaminomethyl(34) synthesis enzyme MnmG [Sphingomonas sp.]|uniref:tRNA uridine-5-carboxymethylaminomethyl(34) synthesis enzyme MnmG n=1 Tax=Sphingomonas sp. TaxID=28214 RepID=UPI002BB6FF09|nr:tRNA uridine-5-carboxymethylaminomethyl(34) synthesis enzyme MnmG [Sphingomonas sp.]HMI19934.1 tRNA uridine-5-carboxymethylaminomethyl(34) synthesis enzyme MnmG [Sphingomonas sp.]